MPAKTKPDTSELVPIDWERVEIDYRAGILSIREIAKLRGCSHTLINRKVKQFGWTRDLRAKIHAKADELVSKAAVSRTVSTVSMATEADAVAVRGEMLAAVRLQHFDNIATLRVIIASLMRELATVMDYPEKFAQAYDVLANLDEPAIGVLQDMAGFVGSITSRTKNAKDLADALHKCIGMEREAFGLDTNGGTDGMPIVLIKDFTGKGDPDSPFFGQPEPDDEY